MNCAMLADTHNALALEKLDRLRAELVELALVLECRGHLDAADVAITTSARVAEIRDELVADENEVATQRGVALPSVH